MQGAVADLKNVCSSHEFIVETIKADDAEYLSSVFTDALLTAKDTLLFLGEQFKMFEVLEFITELTKGVYVIKFPSILDT